ncbi:MAG TPA: phage holin family protein [Candidatus Limnocylindrales bacterium]
MSLIQRLVSFYQLQIEVLWKWRPGRRALIKRAIVSLICGTIALLLTVVIMPGIKATSLWTIVVAVIVLALFNALVRPVVLALFAGVSTIAVIIATLVMQVVSFLFIEWLLPDFQVTGVIAAFLGPFVFALFNTLFAAILNADSGETFYGALVAQLARRRPDAIVTDKPGLVIVQIDGLAQPILAQQVRAGRVPFISHWIRSGQMKLDRWTALLPSQTSASQAGILHGNNSFIPAFRWWEKDTQRMLVSNHPDDATEIVRRASNGEGLLSNDGASVGNLVSGDATRSYITMATIKDPSQGLGQSRAWYSFFVSPDKYLRAGVLTVGEIIKEYVQAISAERRGVEPSMHRGMPYPIARAATNVILRSLATSLVMEEMYRGTPVIYVDYTDYDEIAHHSGPERSETLDALDGVDATVRALVKATDDTPRPYRFVLLGDHGQSLGATFKQRYGVSLHEYISQLMGGSVDVAAATGRVEEWGALNAVATEASRASGTTGALTRAALGSRTQGGAIDLAPKKEEVKTEDATEPPELVVCASGNLALIYFPRLPGRVSLETIEKAWPGLLNKLSHHEGVGLIMGRSETAGTVAMGRDGNNYLDSAKVDGEDPVAQFGEHAVAGLKRVDGMEHCPDLVAISLLDPSTGEVAAFEELIGSHGGLGGPQTEPFILHPSDWAIDEPIVGAENVYRQIRRWLSGMGIELGSPAKAGEPAETA